MKREGRTLNALVAGQVRDVARGGSWGHGGWLRGWAEGMRGQGKAVGLPGLGEPKSPTLFPWSGPGGRAVVGSETSPGTGGVPGSLWDSVAPDGCRTSTPSPLALSPFFKCFLLGRSCCAHSALVLAMPSCPFLFSNPPGHDSHQNW